MQQKFEAINNIDENGFPAGGWAVLDLGLASPAILINWQNGPLGRGDDRLVPNGAFVETVLAIVAQRIESYQRGPTACEENARVLDHLDAALKILAERTARREAAGTEGTLEGN